MSPSRPASRGSGSDGDRRHSRYISGVRVVDVSQPERTSPSGRRRRPAAEPTTTSSSTSLPIPIKRASTMPYGMETPPERPERGRRPIIVEQLVPRQPAAPAGPPTATVEMVEHGGSRVQRRLSRRDSEFLLPYREHSRSPQGYGSAEDDRERRERRRRRRDARAHAAVMPASAPSAPDAIYGSSPLSASSYGSSQGSSSFAPPPPPRRAATVEPSAAVAAVKKELRWEDQLRAQQNERISQRPKLGRSVTAAPVQAEVKSILKNGNTSPSPSSSKTRRNSSAAVVSEDELAALYRSVEDMSLLHERESSTQRRAREAEEHDSAAYMDRLRNRFSMPPRRFTAGAGAKRPHRDLVPGRGPVQVPGLICFFFLFFFFFFFARARVCYSPVILHWYTSDLEELRWWTW